MKKTEIHKLIKESINEVLYENFNLTNDIGKDDYVDDEGRMAKSQLYKMGKYAVKLHGMLNDMEQLPSWVQAKITKASDYMSMVYHYLDYEFARSEGNLEEMRPSYGSHDNFQPTGQRRNLSRLPGVMEEDALIDSGIKAYNMIMKISPNKSLKGAFERESRSSWEDINVDNLSPEQAMALTRVVKDVRAPITFKDNPEMYDLEEDNVITTFADGSTDFLTGIDPKTFDDIKGDVNIKNAKTTKGVKIKEYIMKEISSLIEASYEAPEEIINALKSDLKMNPITRYVDYLKAADTIPPSYEVFLRNGKSFFIIYEKFSLAVKIEAKKYFLGDSNEKAEAKNHLNRLLTDPKLNLNKGVEGEEEFKGEETPAEEPAEEPEA